MTQNKNSAKTRARSRSRMCLRCYQLRPLSWYLTGKENYGLCRECRAAEEGPLSHPTPAVKNLGGGFWWDKED